MHASGLLASLFIATGALAQAVSEGVGPDASAPEGCVTTSETNFTIGVLNGFDTQQSASTTTDQTVDGALVCSLNDGILRDQSGRTGSVVANDQFQFDGPPQAGAIYTGGFSICANDSLAIGDTTRWWQCSSGAFFNLYDKWIGDQCNEIRIQIKYEKSSGSSSSAASSATSGVASAALSTSLSTATGSSHSSSTLSSGGTSLSSSHSATGTTSSRSTSSSPSSASAATQNAVAPSASAGAATISQMRSGATLGVVMAIIGAGALL